MKIKPYVWLAAAALTGAITFSVLQEPSVKTETRQEKDKEQKTRYHEDRMRYEFDMVKDPITGKIPEGIVEKERAFALSAPVKGAHLSEAMRMTVLNSYIPAGPNNIGGRTRAVRYDMRYNGTSNRVIIAGCVSGGIMRSTDGGNSWTLVTPEGDIHSFTALAQDPRPGFQDTWYAGGGEVYGNTASEIGASYLGYGIWKSTNNGATWTKLPLNTITDFNGTQLPAGSLEAFDHPFDFVHRIAVNPSNGHVYIAAHRRVIRTTDGGNTFQTIFGSTVASTATAGQTDVTITTDGKVYLAMNGGYPDLTKRGIWTSSTGNLNSFSRIAGGQILNVDSIPGWRANSATNQSKRILLALAPSNQNIMYVYYENGLSQESPQLKPEADLFRMEASGNTFTWSNRSANMPDFQGGNLAGSDPLAVQNGYNMMVTVKPNDPNTVFIGGTNLYRSTDGFATTTNTAWINGYNTNFTYQQYPEGHADIHELVFNPANVNVAICGNDGGIQETDNIMAGTVEWDMLPNYQTLQYYYVAMDPGAGRNNFVGGAQDNGTMLRDKTGILGAIADSNNHIRINSGDGTAVGFSAVDAANNNNQYVYGGSQYGMIRRIRITNTFNSVNIRPSTATAFPDRPEEFGEFVTNFRLHPENTELLFYGNFNRLFRTTTASTVTPSTWTELTGVAQAVNPVNPTSGTDIRIRAMAFSRGAYNSSHVMYIGTTPDLDATGTIRQGKIFRLNDPRNAAPETVPVDITPAGLQGNVQDIAVNPNNDNEIVAVVSNYNAVSIWWTNNAKSATPTWRNAEGNLTLPSVRSCVIAAKKDASGKLVTEYYVGTSVGLYSVTDLATTLQNGGTPQWQREGGTLLNFAVVQSMAYRPTDNVLLLGTHGNGMYYTYLGTPAFGTSGPEPEPGGAQIFIRLVVPQVTRDRVEYRIGNLTTVKRIKIQVYNSAGALVKEEEKTYTTGEIDLRRVAAGVYFVRITSSEGNHKFIQKIIKQ